MDTKDTEGHFINVQLPGKDKEDLDLSKVPLPMKYTKELKIKDEKMTDLLEMRKQLSAAGNWIDELDARQKSGTLCQQSEEKCESIFKENTWGANNSMDRETVKKIENPENALKGNKEIEFKKYQKSRKTRQSSNGSQTEIDYAISQTGEKLYPIYELEENFNKMKN